MTVELEQERKQLIEAMDWIDIQRKGQNGDYEANRWLYERRCRCRDRLGDVNVALKDVRMANNGRPSDGFGAVFVRVAKEVLASETFDVLMSEAQRRCGGVGITDVEGDSEGGQKSVLDGIREEWDRFRGKVVPKVVEAVHGASGGLPGADKESQEDFGILKGSSDGDLNGITRPVEGGQGSPIGRFNRTLNRPFGSKRAYA